MSKPSNSIKMIELKIHKKLSLAKKYTFVYNISGDLYALL